MSGIKNPVNVLIAANVAIFGTWLNLSNDSLYNKWFSRHMVLSPSRVRAGHWDCLVGHAFMHMQPLHLLFNMLALKSFGDTAHMMLGTRTFLGLYFASAIGGGLAQLYYPTAVRKWNLPARGSVHWDQSAVGASAAIAGITMYVCSRVPQGEVVLVVLPVPNYVFVPLFIGGSAYMAYTGGDTTWAHAGHLGGALVGFALFLARRGRY